MIYDSHVIYPDGLNIEVVYTENGERVRCHVYCKEQAADLVSDVDAAGGDSAAIIAEAGW